MEEKAANTYPDSRAQTSYPDAGAQSRVSESAIDFEREKLILERERLALERERLENERLRHRQTVEISNGAAGRVVLPASSFMLSILVAMFLGGTIGAWIVASRFRPTPASIAESVARAIGTQALFDEDDPDGTNTLETVSARIFRSGARIARGSGYLLILD